MLAETNVGVRDRWLDAVFALLSMVVARKTAADMKWFRVDVIWASNGHSMRSQFE